MRTITLLAILLISISALAAQVEDPASRYRVLDWKDLVPEGWEPPLVANSYEDVSAATIDKASMVQGLDQQLVALPGFMKPVVFEGNQVTEFMLVPFLPHHTRQHAHLEANQVVYVYLLEPLQVDNPFDPVWVVGTLTLDSVMTDDGPAGYRIADAVTTNYERRKP